MKQSLLRGAIASFMLLLACSLQVFADDYNSTRVDFRDESIYFVITTRFYDGDPYNNVLCWDNQEAQIETGDPCWRGDFAGLIEKLDYIKALGFSAIWITPIVQNASGYDYHGYHAMDFSRVDCRYLSDTTQGSEEDVDFQDLIDAAHDKDMKIILDIVLNHTGNFGEENLIKEFDRNYKIHNQASIDACMIPVDDVLGSDYADLESSAQYNKRLAMLKNTDGNNNDTHNYYHHVANSWNWDEPSRWWGQIAGDCVDLNTENNAVAAYLVKCYGEFIKMGVDGFRIDTSGHISRLTFNKVFIDQFAEIGEQYASKRLNNAPFFMYGEVCARYGGVTYRNQQGLSPYYYTWESDATALSSWDTTDDYWEETYVAEGAEPCGNMLVCLQDDGLTDDDGTAPTSDNTFMIDGAYHEPDYSESSGFNVIDFPLHYNFTSASSAYGLACSGDKYYNDATYNVVYVDSHDYGPQPNDGVRFSGDDAQWAENLSLMFTFRGIPCLYYGSEIGFRRGYTIDNGTNGALNNTGRAYYGGYITGDVTASDFGEYEASGNAAVTLSQDLAQHLIRLNKIRQAVPALRRGQWTSDGCTASGGIAFRRATADSYALVALNGGATFTDCPSGTYTDVVTGATYTGGGTITVSAPTNQGQVRVLVKDWSGGQIGTDGPFIYSSSSVSSANGSYDGAQEEGTDIYYTTDDATGSAKITITGTNFSTETTTITATLGGDAVSGTVVVGSTTYTLDSSTSSLEIEIGADMEKGETLVITWTAVDSEGNEYTGTKSIKKLDPDATITVYVNASSSTYYMYVWNDDDGAYTAAWPGDQLSSLPSVELCGETFYYQTFDTQELNVIFNAGSGNSQTGDITGIDADVYYTYSGGTSATDVTSTYIECDAVENSSSSSTDYSCTSNVTYYLAGDFNDWLGSDDDSASNSNSSSTDNSESGSTDSGITVYVSSTSSSYYLYAWDTSGNSLLGSWPGTQMSNLSTTTVDGTTYYYYTFTGLSSVNVIFNTGNGGSQTGDITDITSDVYYSYSGGTTATQTKSLSLKSSSSTTTVWCSGNSSYYMYAWDSSENSLLGSWPGTQFSNLATRVVDGTVYYGYTFDVSTVNVIFNTGSSVQTEDITNLTGTNYFSYLGSTSYSTVTVSGNAFTPDDDYAFTCQNGELTLELSADAISTTDGFMVYGSDGNVYSYAGTIDYSAEYTYAADAEDPTYLASAPSGETVTFVITAESVGSSLALKVVDGEYETDTNTAIAQSDASTAVAPLRIYSLSGAYLGTVSSMNDARLKTLPRGLYIVGGKKYLAK